MTADTRPHFTFFVFPSADDPEPIATIICKLDMHRERTMRGYIGMLSVDKRWRRRSIGGCWSVGAGLPERGTGRRGRAVGWM
jgi:hypothetical protein